MIHKVLALLIERITLSTLAIGHRGPPRALSVIYGQEDACGAQIALRKATPTLIDRKHAGDTPIDAPNKIMVSRAMHDTA